jgi:RNA polymerase sigma-70 factor (sigma-E family)
MRLCAMGIDIRGSATGHSAQRPAAGWTTASGAAASGTAAGEAAAAVAAGRDPASAEAGVTALFEAHSLGLTRLAHIMLGDRSGAEDVVQEAFCGLYRRWPHLSDQAKALPYLRSCVLNGCRTVLRRIRPRDIEWGDQPWAASAEAAVVSGEDRREVMQALRRLPHRQREVLVLRFYLDLSDAEIARDMEISPGTVRSTASRALTALGRSLGGTA